MNVIYSSPLSVSAGYFAYIYIRNPAESAIYELSLPFPWSPDHWIVTWFSQYFRHCRVSERAKNLLSDAYRFTRRGSHDRSRK